MSLINICKHKFLILFSYIGTKYSGIQRQTARKSEIDDKKRDNSVQYYIEKSLEAINPKPSQDVKLAVSSRTDKGVHAIENSGHLELVHPNPEESYCPSLILETANEYFKANYHDIKLNKIHLISPEFHIRKHVKWRSYYYRLAVIKPEIASHTQFQPESYLPIAELNRCSLFRVPINLDLGLMEEVVDLFRGTHDFTNFAAFSRSLQYYMEDHFTRKIDQFTINQIDLEQLESFDSSYRNINLYEFNIRSRSFLYRQIRRMVGMTIMVSSGRFPIDRFKAMLDDPTSNKWSSNYYTAPPEGLYLSRIKYDYKDFLNPPPKLFYYGNFGPQNEPVKRATCRDEEDGEADEDFIDFDRNLNCQNENDDQFKFFKPIK